MPSEKENACPACNTGLSKQPYYNGGWIEWDCPNCGIWGVSDRLLGQENIPSLTEEELQKLSSLLLENRLRRGPRIFLSDTHVAADSRKPPFLKKDEFLGRYPVTPLEYYDRALENLSRMVKHPTGRWSLTRNLWRALFANGSAAKIMLRELAELGYIHFEEVAMGDPLVGLRPKGWERIRQLRQPGRDSRQAFVAMWFDASMTPFYEQGIKPAVEADGIFRALRIDSKAHNNKIDDEIIAELRRSRFVVADFSGHRGGVYFEAGFALGLGLPVIWTCRHDQLDKTHFDTRQYNHIVYRTPAELHDQLLNRIRATIV